MQRKIMEKKLVTARIKHLATLREEHVKTDSVLVLPGEFTVDHPEKGPVRFKFKDPGTGLALESMHIIGQMAFDLSKAVDRENWMTLQALLHTQPTIKALILLDDPEAEADKDIQKTKLMLVVSRVIEEHENDPEFLAQLYRRLIGVANGITNKQVYRGLMELATKEPEKFVSASGKMIFEDESFKMLSLIDVAIEKGFFVKDSEGFIKLKTGEPYATDIHKAAFRLKDDSKTLDALNYDISDAHVVKPSGYTPNIEDSDFMSLLNAVGEKVETDSGLDNFGLDADLKLEADIADKLPQLIDKNFIEEIKIQGGNIRFVIPGLSQKFKKEELSAYFKMNSDQFIDLVSQAGI